MTAREKRYNKWYLWLLSLYFVVIGVGYCIYLISAAAKPGFMIPWESVLPLAVLMAGSAIFFVRRRLGHHLMLATAVAIILFMGPRGTVQENIYWAFILAVLLLPMARWEEAVLEPC